MISLWKNLREIMRESVCENCEELSTKDRVCRESLNFLWINFVFNKKLHYVWTGFYTYICEIFNLFSRRFYTLST